MLFYFLQNHTTVRIMVGLPQLEEIQFSVLREKIRFVPPWHHIACSSLGIKISNVKRALLPFFMNYFYSPFVPTLLQFTPPLLTRTNLTQVRAFRNILMQLPSVFRSKRILSRKLHSLGFQTASTLFSSNDSINPSFGT